ncbi:MAG: methyltransferase domain-containing protein [Candidatus Omnitrophica bacterium]|nr:methyltransferase domain-containing protein [Candidatus Omnitrophota bacterium]
MNKAVRKTTGIIERNFSRHAGLYDEYADVQSLAADELIKRVPDGAFGRILDIGCGTGNYTLLLRDRFKTAEIEALDISADMVRVARHKCGGKRIGFIIADAERYDPAGLFDLITSNATFQWFDDLGRALERYTAALAPGGYMSFSTFGPLTFHELSRSIKETAGSGVGISSGGFPAAGTVASLLKKYFTDSSVEERTVKRSYASLGELLRHIKYTGTRGRGVEGMFNGRRGILSAVEKEYRLKFGRIEASYQIFFCGGRL